MPAIQTDGPNDGLASAEIHWAGNEVMGWNKVYGTEKKKYKLNNGLGTPSEWIEQNNGKSKKYYWLFCFCNVCWTGQRV